MWEVSWGKYYHAVLKKCHKDTLAASLLVAVESYFHRFLKVYDIIQLFHVPSRFIGTLLEKSGVPARKIYYHCLTIDLDRFKYSKNFSNVIVCYGRLVAQKGILTLLQAFQMLESQDVTLKIVGEGPEKSSLESYVKENHIDRVSFVGYQGGQDLIKLLANAMFVVVPSQGYENSPLTILEPFALGKPVIGTRIGGIPELIRDGENGYLFELGNAESLASKMEALLKAPDDVAAFGRSAREFALNHFAPGIHYKAMLTLYQKLIKSERNK